MNQKKILIGLLSLLAIVIVYRLTNPFVQETVDRLTHTRATKVAAKKAASSPHHQAEVRVDLLRSPPQNDVAVQRDLFQPPSARKSAIEGEKTPPPPVQAPQPKSQQEEIQEHFSRFKAFGSHTCGKKTYLFLQRGKQVLVITKGDRIDGKFEVTSVSDKKVTISAEGLSEPVQVTFDEL